MGLPVSSYARERAKVLAGNLAGKRRCSTLVQRPLTGPLAQKSAQTPGASQESAPALKAPKGVQLGHNSPEELLEME